MGAFNFGFKNPDVLNPISVEQLQSYRAATNKRESINSAIIAWLTSIAGDKNAIVQNAVFDLTHTVIIIMEAFAIIGT
jgi:hypothetical protein